MTTKQQAAALIAKADEDIHVLTVLCGDAATSDAMWGFHAQQAVEKLLKALLAARGLTFPFTHRLLQLADLLDDAQLTLEARFDPLLDLTPFAVEWRYAALSPDSDERSLDRAALLKLITDLRQTVETSTG